MPAGEGPIDLFVPIAQNGPQQKILGYAVRASIPGTEGRDNKYGNRCWHGHLGRSDGQPITVTVAYRVRREPLRHDHLGVARSGRHSEEVAGKRYDAVETHFSFEQGARAAASWSGEQTRAHAP